MTAKSLFIERREGKDEAIRRPDSKRARATAPTQEEAIAKSKARDPARAIYVGRVRKTATGLRDKWRNRSVS